MVKLIIKGHWLNPQPKLDQFFYIPGIKRLQSYNSRANKQYLSTAYKINRAYRISAITGYFLFQKQPNNNLGLILNSVVSLTLLSIFQPPTEQNVKI